MSLLLLSKQAREVLGMPDHWHAYRFEAVRQGGLNAGCNAPVLHTSVTGICCPLKTRGKNKGHPNYKRGDITTRRTCYITPAMEIEWRAKWEIETGNCINCMGKGQSFKSWHHLTGTEYQTCPKCEGTGKSKPRATPGS